MFIYYFHRHIQPFQLVSLTFFIFHFDLFFLLPSFYTVLCIYFLYIYIYKRNQVSGFTHFFPLTYRYRDLISGRRPSAMLNLMRFTIVFFYLSRSREIKRKKLFSLFFYFLIDRKWKGFAGLSKENKNDK